jgi:hypothetical protein
MRLPEPPSIYRIESYSVVRSALGYLVVVGVILFYLASGGTGLNADGIAMRLAGAIVTSSLWCFGVLFIALRFLDRAERHPLASTGRASDERKVDQLMVLGLILFVAAVLLTLACFARMATVV